MWTHVDLCSGEGEQAGIFKHVLECLYPVFWMIIMVSYESFYLLSSGAVSYKIMFLVLKFLKTPKYSQNVVRCKMILRTLKTYKITHVLIENGLNFALKNLFERENMQSTQQNPRSS